MDNIERALRMEIATKQLEIDKLKNKIRRMEDDNNTRQRSDTIREKTVRSTTSSDSDK